MRILLTGATGFIGTHLIEKLIEQGIDQWVFLTRFPEKLKLRLKLKLNFPVRIYAWDPIKETPPTPAFEGVGAVIHLAGENIAGWRWSKEKKKKIYESRVIGTQNLLKGITESYSLGLLEQNAPSIPLISASGVHYYGSCGDEILEESASAGARENFLSRVCQDWEASFLNTPLPSERLRRVVLRFGLVLSPQGGVLKRMLPGFQLGIAGKLGPGSQYMSWIHLDDLLDLLEWTIRHSKGQGVYNAVAPHPVTNAEFTRVMGEVLRRPTLVKAPSLFLKMVLGEMSHLVLDSQRAIPQRALAEGFQFRFPLLPGALSSLLLHTK